MPAAPSSSAADAIEGANARQRVSMEANVWVAIRRNMGMISAEIFVPGRRHTGGTEDSDRSALLVDGEADQTLGVALTELEERRDDEIQVARGLDQGLDHVGRHG